MGGQPTTGIINGDDNNVGSYGGVWLLKNGPNGFTNVGRGAASSVVDTTLAYEAWTVAFFNANNDNWIDMLVPSYRNGFSKLGLGTSGARKGCVLFLNDGTGKFAVPTAASLGRKIYALDSVIYAVSGIDSLIYASAHADMGIIVDDTVRHFEGLAIAYGDFNGDGIMDIFFGSNNARNRDGFGRYSNVAIVYGKGDGTFTYKWDGTNIVSNNGLPSIYSRAWNVGDYNNDGKLDIVSCDGTNTLLRNNGDGTFTNVTATDGLTGAAIAMRATAFVDYNNDGWLEYLFLYGRYFYIAEEHPRHQCQQMGRVQACRYWTQQVGYWSILYGLCRR